MTARAGLSVLDLLGCMFCCADFGSENAFSQQYWLEKQLSLSSMLPRKNEQDVDGEVDKRSSPPSLDAVDLQILYRSPDFAVINKVRPRWQTCWL